MAVMASPMARAGIQQGPAAMYAGAGMPGWLANILGMATPDPFTGPMGGFGMALGGPKINVPSALMKLLKMGKEAPTAPQWTGLNRPWPGILREGEEAGRSIPSRSWTSPTHYRVEGSDLRWEDPQELMVESKETLGRLLREMGPQVDLNDPGLVRNAEMFRNLGFAGD